MRSKGRGQDSPSFTISDFPALDALYITAFVQTLLKNVFWKLPNSAFLGNLKKILTSRHGAPWDRDSDKEHSFATGLSAVATGQPL